MTAAYRICHVTSVHPLDDVRIVRKEVRSLVEAGYDVWVVGTEGRVDRSVRARFATVPIQHRNRLQRISVHAARVVRTALSIRADLYHLHDPELLPWISVLKQKGAKVVYDAHEDVAAQTLSKEYIHASLRSITSRVIGSVERRLAWKCDAVVAANAAIERRFAAHPRVVLVRNMPRCQEFVLSKCGYDGSRKTTVAYLGGISAIRGIWQLLEALRELGGRIRLELMGEFETAELFNRCRKHDGWAFVSYHGWVDRLTAVRILCQCTAGLVTYLPQPNHVEAGPNKLFEYMAAGLPVIASDFPAWRELLGEVGCALFVDPRDPRGIANAIQWLLDHPVEAEAMGRRGQEAIVEHFNWENEARALLELYRELLHE